MGRSHVYIYIYICEPKFYGSCGIGIELKEKNSVVRIHVGSSRRLYVLGRSPLFVAPLGTLHYRTAHTELGGIKSDLVRDFIHWGVRTIDLHYRLFF